VIDLRDAGERDALAGEYVLGLLSAEDHDAFASAIARDLALQAAVYAWQDRLLALSTRAEPVAPRPSLWPRIDIALNAAASQTPRVAPRPASATVRWWQRLGVWQGLSAAAMIAVVVLGGLLVQQRPDAPAGVRYVAMLQSPSDQSVGWVVELQADRMRLVPTAVGGPVPPGRSLQFWTKPDGAAGPTSLGLVRAGQTLELPLSRLPGAGAQQLFEITLEPEGGSTIGRPTGPILYVGRTVAL
jgi:anti-sigma-K factor RskA